MDIGIMPGKNFDEKILFTLSEKLNESIIPFKVDVVNFSTVSQKFKDEALKDVIEWK